MGRRVERTRNMGTMTEAEWWTRLRSALRKQSTYSKVAKECLKRARVTKGLSRCASCLQTVPNYVDGLDRDGKHRRVKNIFADHIIPCGSFKSYDEMGAFAERLFLEDPDDFQALCTECHQVKTNEEAAARKAAKNSPANES